MTKTQDPRNPKSFLPTIGSPTAPTAATPAWLAMVARRRNKLDPHGFTFTVAAKDALTARERANFEYRRDHISDRLNPARKPVIAERVTKFLSAYPLVQR